MREVEIEEKKKNPREYIAFDVVLKNNSNNESSFSVSVLRTCSAPIDLENVLGCCNSVPMWKTRKLDSVKCFSYSLFVACVWHDNRMIWIEAKRTKWKIKKKEGRTRASPRPCTRVPNAWNNFYLPENDLLLTFTFSQLQSTTHITGQWSTRPGHANPQTNLSITFATVHWARKRRHKMEEK